jgi:ornithine carbamoyltransferase
MTGTTDATTDDATGLDVLDVDDLVGHLGAVLDRAAELKRAHRANEPYRFLSDRTLAMLFEKPSTRTRVSFETGMTRLGGHAIMMSPEHTQLGRGEPIKDTARALSGYVDGIMARVRDHDELTELAEYASVPVINGLSDDAHPAQTLADLLTIREAFGGFDLSVAWVGDGNNVASSFALGCAMTGIDLTVATPEAYGLSDDVLSRAEALGGRPDLAADPAEAVAGADLVYTDVWVNMGQEAERAERLAAFEGYQVNDDLLSGTDARVMHCLPAHRGEEITDAVLEGDRALVWQQAENRMHAQNGLLVELLS